MTGNKDSCSYPVYSGRSAMKKTENEEARLTAYCGLYCGDCLRFRSQAAELSRDLLAELKSMQFERYAKVKKAAVKELEHYNECIDVLDAIVKLGCDTPCQLGGEGCSNKPCEVKICAQAKKLNGCWECDIFETCDKFDFLIPVHGDTTKGNLRKIREYGPDGWAKHRNRFYPWK